MAFVDFGSIDSNGDWSMIAVTYETNTDVLNPIYSRVYTWSITNAEWTLAYNGPRTLTSVAIGPYLDADADHILYLSFANDAITSGATILSPPSSNALLLSLDAAAFAATTVQYVKIEITTFATSAPLNPSVYRATPALVLADFASTVTDIPAAPVSPSSTPALIGATAVIAGIAAFAAFAVMRGPPAIK